MDGKVPAVAFKDTHLSFFGGKSCRLTLPNLVRSKSSGELPVHSPRIWHWMTI